MHSIARESLQNYLYSYKESSKEPGLGLVYDARRSHSLKRGIENIRALRSLRTATHMKVAFAVRTNASYDGALENKSPLPKKTISFKKHDFLHIYERYNSDWWIGRVVARETTIGFIPTAKRLSRLVDQNEDETEKKTGKNLVTSLPTVWECPSPYTVVPSTRPIILLGPCFHQSRLTELMHAAVRSAIVKRFGNRVRRLSSDIGEKNSSKSEYDTNERELRVITALAEDLHLVLLETPNINTPADAAKLNIAPIFILIRITNRKILLKLLKKTGIIGGTNLAGADVLSGVATDQVDVIIEENGLPEATGKIYKFLDDYWDALHPKTSLLEDEYNEIRAQSCGRSSQNGAEKFQFLSHD